MNENMRISAHGLRLLKRFERGDPDQCELSPGGAALTPYLCPAGELTIGWGSTFWFDGSDVEVGDRLADEAEAEKLLMKTLERFEAHVRSLLTVAVTQFQFDALVCLAFNIGVGNFSKETCSALNRTNDHRLEDAAEAFGLWTGAKTAKPTAKQFASPAYARRVGTNSKGKPVWRGPEGQPCMYLHRLEGLLTRHLSEACLYMGYNWDFIPDRAVFLIPAPPNTSIWNARKCRWEEGTKDQTRFATIREIVKDYPLEELNAGPVQSPVESVPAPAAPVESADLAAAAQPTAGEEGPAPTPQAEAPVPSTSSVVLEETKIVVSPPVGTKPIDPNTKQAPEVPYGVDPSAGAKPMEKTERFAGSVLMVFATVLRSLMAKGRFAAGAVGTVLTGFMALFDNPATRDLLVGALVVVFGIVAATSVGVWIAIGINKKGLKIKRRGEATARQLMY